MVDKNFTCLTVLVLGLITTVIIAQEQAENQNYFPTQVTINNGMGYYAIRDEVFSKEKYAGKVVPFEIIWNQERGKYFWQFDMLYKQGTHLENYHTTADVREFTMSWDYLYKRSPIDLFGRSLSLAVGPSPEMFIHVRQQRIAEFTSDLYSFAMLISISANTRLVYDLSPKIKIENFNRLSLLSVGLRMTDFRNNDNNDKIYKPLSVFSGLNFKSDIGVRYRLTDMFSVKVAYSIYITRISAWDYYLSANDNFNVYISILF